MTQQQDSTNDSIPLREYMENQLDSKLHGAYSELAERISGLDRITDEKFVKFRTMIDSQAEKVALALASADKAVLKAETATEKRFEAVNEFRQTLSDQTATFIPRIEADQRIKQLEQKIDDLKGSSKAGANALWGYILGAAGLIGAVIAIVTR